MTDLITADLVRLDADLGTDKHDVIRALASIVASADRAVDVDRIIEDALAREAKSATGLKGGIAIPHCRTTGVDVPTLVFARLTPPVDFGAKDGPADLAFLIAAPAGGDNTHLQILTKLARALVKEEFTDGLRAAVTADDVIALVAAAVADAPHMTPVPKHVAPPATAGPTTADKATATAGSATATAATATATRRLVAVTACPTGIAHTYMAAEALEVAAEKAGVTIEVETQGSAGSTPLKPATIAAADAVIFAVDVGVRDRGRFAGKPVVSSGVKRPIDEADAMIAEALRYADDPSAPRVEGSVTAGEGGSGSDSIGATVRRVR